MWSVQIFQAKVLHEEYSQLHSQPDNLVPLCKFQIIVISHFFSNWLFSKRMNWKYLHIAGLNCRVGYATEYSSDCICKGIT